MGDPVASRRRHPRVALELPVRLTSIDPERDRRGAPFFRATREHCGRRGGGAGCGVEFLGLSSEERAPLERWLVRTSV